MPILRKVISGGQTGADKTGLQEARKLGLETGGTAPKGYRTDEGADFSLRDVYGLAESPYYDYAPRTRQNVVDSDVTVWFGRTNSSGYFCTRKHCQLQDKPLYENPTDLQLDYLTNTYETWNIAGNRRRLNAQVIPMVEAAFKVAAEVLGNRP
jgi:hypothetical protein